MIKNNTWPVAKLVAHRGASMAAPENTLAALTKAGELGATWVEADVRLTLDGEAIIFHDTQLNRCTNGRGLVRKTPYSVIAELDAGSWFSPQYVGERIPVLEQWIQHAAEQGFGIVLDLKGNRWEAKRLVDQVAAALARYWSTDLPLPLISSESEACLQAAYMQQLGWNLAYIMPQEHSQWVKIVNKFNCMAVHLDHQAISQRWLDRLKQQGVHIAAYTVNDPARAQQLFDWGIETIFSDNPLLFTAGTAHSPSEH